jgi:hypothetical protein
MWRWVHKNIHRIFARHIWKEVSHEDYNQLSKITQMIVDAVERYNETLPLPGNLKIKDVDELVIKEAEEESAKVFLDGILDLAQKENTKNDFPRE